ncbi:MAG: Wzz/FepE/Etk N-terminal domain-containing protein [Chlorobium phaeovibrioides]|nr:Wzz/FepE/Etk N-terminal domain-containing protein [Chlorobium phaeovibrioides]
MSDTPVSAHNPHFQRPDPYDDEISLLDLAITLAKHKKLIIGLPLAVAIVTAVVTLFMPVSYTATTRLLPRNISEGMIASFVKSQPMADSLISRFELKEAYRAKSIISASSLSAFRQTCLLRKCA